MTFMVNHEIDGVTQSIEVEIFIDGISIEEVPTILPESLYAFYIGGLLEASMFRDRITNLSQTRTDEEIIVLIKAALATAND